MRRRQTTLERKGTVSKEHIKQRQKEYTHERLLEERMALLQGVSKLKKMAKGK